MKNVGEIAVGNRKMVGLGHRVCILDCETNKEIRFTLVGEHGGGFGFVTTVAPVGKSVLGKKVGDEFVVEAPIGQRRFKVISTGEM